MMIEPERNEEPEPQHSMVCETEYENGVQLPNGAFAGIRGGDDG
jgi:hypothetical protein